MTFLRHDLRAPIAKDEGWPEATGDEIAHRRPYLELILAHVDLFAGSGSTLEVCKATGRRGIGFEVRESQCEEAAKRLAQDNLFGGVA